MPKFLISLPFVTAMLASCAPPSATNTESAPPVVVQGRDEPKEIATLRIIEILETGDLAHISTRHDQSILIRLHDGSEYRGKYVQPSSGPYADDEHLFDIYNLVRRITDARDDLQHLHSMSTE